MADDKLNIDSIIARLLEGEENYVIHAMYHVVLSWFAMFPYISFQLRTALCLHFITCIFNVNKLEISD